MYDSNSKGISWTAAFFILVGFSLVGLLIGGLLSIPIWTNMTGRSIFDMQGSLNNPEYAPALRMIQVVSVTFWLLVPSIAAAWLINRKPFRMLGLTRPFTTAQLSLIIGLVITGVLISGALGTFFKMIPISEYWTERYEQLDLTYAKQVEMILDLENINGYFYSLFMIAVLPAVAEELFFRGGLQNYLHKATGNLWFSILFVSIIFSLVHMSYFAFVPRVFLGVMLGLIYYYSGSLWLAILAHFINNAMAVTIVYYFSKQGEKLEESLGKEAPYYWGLLAIPVFVFLIIRLRKVSTPMVEPTTERPADNPF